MKRLLLLIVPFLMLYSCSKVRVLSPGPAQEELADMKKGAEIVRVNDTIIREGYLEMLSVINPRVKSQISNPAMKKKMVESLVDQELLYQESIERGLDRKKEVMDKAALYKRIIIAQALLEEEMTRKAREYYDQHKDVDFTKVAVSHIQIDFKKPEDPVVAEKTGEKGAAESKKVAKKKEPPTEAEKRAALERAKAIKARLDAGEDFVKTASDVNDDNMAKKKGGDLGKISRDDKRLARRGLEKLVEAAFALKMGQISDVIETEKGYHIIKITSEPEVTPFEEAQKTIEFQLQKEVKDGLLAELKQSAKIDYTEEPAAEPLPTSNEGKPENPPPPAGEAPPAPEGTSEGSPSPDSGEVSPEKPTTEPSVEPSAGPSTEPPTEEAKPQGPAEPPPPMAVPAEKKGTTP